jgi:hypothetical protein
MFYVLCLNVAPVVSISLALLLPGTVTKGNQLSNFLSLWAGKKIKKKKNK